MDPKVMQALGEIGVPFRVDEPMSRHTTMGVGGPAAVMAFPRTGRELQQTLQTRAQLGIPHRVLGCGSNLIVADEGLDELIINTRQVRSVAIGEQGEVRAGAGANLIRTALRCCRSSWKGLEWAVGIPGTLGGAVAMNAGAHGSAISDVLEGTVVFGENGESLSPPTAWSFSYRGSSIPEGSAIAALTLRLKPGDRSALEQEASELIRQRTRSQPGGRNAGCIFKNPPGAAAGKIIDDVGLKGTERGAAVVSERHANFIVNRGGARAADVLELLLVVQQTVRRETGIELEPEIKVWRPRK